MLHLQREIKKIEQKMKRKTSKTQLAILSIMAGIVYLFIITSNLVGEWKNIVRGVKDGWEQAEMENRTGKKSSWQNYILSLEPKNFDKFYTDSVLNLKTGKFVPISYERVQVQYEYTEPQNSKSLLIDTGMTLTSISTVILYLLILILFYKLVLAFYRDNIFCNANVRRLRLLGIYALILWVLEVAFYSMYLSTVNSLLELANYKIVISEYLKHELLLLGIILLIATNVMKRAITIKEEQDLTI